MLEPRHATNTARSPVVLALHAQLIHVHSQGIKLIQDFRQLKPSNRSVQNNPKNLHGDLCPTRLLCWGKGSPFRLVASGKMSSPRRRSVPWGPLNSGWGIVKLGMCQARRTQIVAGFLSEGNHHNTHTQGHTPMSNLYCTTTSPRAFGAAWHRPYERR